MLLRKIVDHLPENIRYSEVSTVPAATLVRAVRENGLEGIVAKQAGSTYRSGRSGDRLMWRANRGQEFVIGGYLPTSNTFDSLLVGYYEGRDLCIRGTSERTWWRSPGERCSLISKAER